MCDQPGHRPTHISAAEYASYCCKSKKSSSSSSSTTRFRCADGCCGTHGNQYCCTDDTAVVELAVGLTVASVFLFSVIAFCIFRRLGIIRCKCAEKDSNTQAVLDPALPQIDVTTGDRDPYPADLAMTVTLSAPCPTRSRPDDPPPSYSEVVHNPNLYAKTQTPT